MVDMVRAAVVCAAATHNCFQGKRITTAVVIWSESEIQAGPGV